MEKHLTNHLEFVKNSLPKFNGILEEWKVDYKNNFVFCENKLLQKNKILDMTFKYRFKNYFESTFWFIYEKKIIYNRSTEIDNLKILSNKFVYNLDILFASYIDFLELKWCNSCDPSHYIDSGDLNKISKIRNKINKIWINN